MIGVDLGGTAIKLARFSRADGGAGGGLNSPTPAVPGAVTMALCEAVEQLDPQHHAGVVGIGLPGPMDAAARVARVCINLPGWEEVPLADWLEPRLERQVTLANDGNCAVVGEAWLGAAQGYADVVLLTLGTGVGGGVLLNGSLFTGHNGAAAEPGLIGVDPEGPACNSGNRGSLEQFASIEALRRLSERDPRELGRAAEAGDPEALGGLDALRHLGVGITSLVYMFTPQLVLLGRRPGGSCGSFSFPPFVQRCSGGFRRLTKGCVSRPVPSATAPAASGRRDSPCSGWAG